MEEYGLNVERSFFEGYQYHDPEVEVDYTKVLNKLSCFRTKEGSKNEVEFLFDKENEQSQNDNGLFSKKLTLPAFMNNDAVGRIADFMLARYGNPQKVISVENLSVDKVLKFDKYGLFNRRRKYWETVSDCNTLEDRDWET